MNIAIVDDSATDNKMLASSIKRFCTESCVAVTITCYDSGELFLEKAQLLSLDAVFLDIYMGGITGMEVAQKIRLRDTNCKIIFVTTSKDFAIKSYAVHALYYLLKPFSDTDIKDVMQLLLESTEDNSRYIVVKEGREFLKIFLSDIIYIDYHNHYIQIHTQTGITCSYMKFAEFEKKLIKYPAFMTCYRCLMINMDKIEKIEEKFFLMKNGEYVPINREKAKEIKLRYTRYIFGEMDGEFT